jgi:hypothetical protein
MNYNVVIIGAGPAGTGLLFKALKDGVFDELLDSGIAIIEKSPFILEGNLTNYKINSDTLSNTFLECLEGYTGNSLDLSNLTDEILFLKSYSGKSIPLWALKAFYQKLGVLLKLAILKNPNCSLFLEKKATSVRRNIDGSFYVYIEGIEQPISALSVIQAPGGLPNISSNGTKPIFDTINLDKFLFKSIISDNLIKGLTDESLRILLQNNPKVVILGGSHSAFSSAHYLLNSFPEIYFPDGSIKIYCRSMPKLFFTSRDEALAKNYTDFTEDDFCPVTKRLFRLGGLRMDGRELYMNMLGMDHQMVEKRAVLKIFQDCKDDLVSDLNNASVVIIAFGYSFNSVPLFDADGSEIILSGAEDTRYVNENCELLEHNKRPISNMYAIGLGSGFIPTDSLGGEKSFKGHTNGIWYYQNIIGGIILKQVLNR